MSKFSDMRVEQIFANLRGLMFKISVHVKIIR